MLRTLGRALSAVTLLATASWSVFAQPFAPSDAGTSVNGFQDDFTGSALGANWTVRGANVFSVSNGALHVASPNTDPNHLLYELPGYNTTTQEVLVRIRITSFSSGSLYSRAGVAVGVTAATSAGINFTFRDVGAEGQSGRHTALLDDFRAWGPGQNFVWQMNTWYWMRLRQEPNAASQGGVNDVFTKIWLADGSVAEPSSWQLTWNYTPALSTRSGFAGILAGSSASGDGLSTFDVDYVLIKASGLPTIVVTAGATNQTPVTITNQPQSQTVAEGGSGSFSVVAIGSPPPTFQWFKGAAAISGATNAVYSFSNAAASDDGALFKVVAANVVSNITRYATSTVATLTVIADTNPPALIGAQSMGLDFVQATFSEPISAASVANLNHFTIVGTNGNAPILSATLDATQTNVLLNVSPLIAHATYTLTVSGVTDQSAASNALVFGSANFVAVPLSILITEFLADNTAGITDGDGAYSDWIELQNQTALAANLSGWHLTDDPLNLAKWTFPSTMLQPAQFLVVFASGKDRRTSGAELHTNFKLDANGEYLALVRPDGSIVQEFFFGPQHKDVSFGIVGNTNLFMPATTPGASNGPGVLGFVSDTKFNPNRGFFSNAVSLSITTATAGAEIWYTTNGNVPAPNGAGSVRYTNFLVLSNTATLRAAAFLTNYAPTDVDTHTFIFLATTANQPANPPGFPSSWSGAAADYAMDQQIVTNAAAGYDITNSLLSLPAISLVAPLADIFGAAQGIYYNSHNSGPDWEREASIELIFPDGSPGFQYEGGLRIHGYSSRDHGFTRKHSFHVNFRNEYGPSKLHFPLFPDTGVSDFDQIVLRACSTDSFPVNDINLGRWDARRATYIRDQWMRDALRDLGQPSSHGRYVHLWLNGLYWGIYNIAELLSSDWASAYLGGSKLEYDVLKDYLIVDEGDAQAWNNLTAIVQPGVTTEATYQLIQGNNPNGARNTNYPVYLNLAAYVDYMMIHINAGAEDWPDNNWWSCRRRGPESDGFHFVPWDQEISNESLTRTVTAFGQRFEEVNTIDRAGYFYDRLRGYSNFRQFFMDRAWFAITGNGALAPGPSAARWLARQSEINRAIVAETARWGDSSHQPASTRSNWLNEMNFVAGYWASNQVRAIQRFRNVNLWPVLAPPALGRNGGYFTNSLLLNITHTNATGAIWFTLDGNDPRAASGAHAAAAQSYSGGVTLTNSVRVRARVTDGTNWSPPIEATFLPLQALTNVIVTEIYYNPPGAGAVTGDAFEFIELQNRGAFTLDLSGVHFTAGIDFAFTNGVTLASGSFLVLARDAANFAARFSGVPVHGLYTGKLDNAGETLALADGLGESIFNFAYDDNSPWPTSADGAGDSLQRVNFSGSASNATQWVAGAPTPGGPSPLLDLDGDGLPDAWESAHGLDPNDASGDNGANGDPDHDGQTNLQEYIAGTSPTSALSVLKFDSISMGPGVTLVFSAASNKTYTVQCTPALGTGWGTLTNIPARVTNFVEVISEPALAINRFYRLVTPMQP